jgi:small redox-active disulfide protein 2
MKIQVLGSGCATCKKLYEITQRAVVGLDASVEYITGEEGIQKIVELGAMGSPVLSVDGKIAMVGFTPNVEDIKEAIVTASQE